MIVSRIQKGGNGREKRTVPKIFTLNGLDLAQWGLTPTTVGNVTIYDATNVSGTSGSVSASVTSGVVFVNSSSSGTSGSDSYTSSSTYVRVIAQNGTAAPSITLIKV